MDYPGLAVFGVALFTFLTISAVAGMITEYKKRRLQLEAVRAAIERGQPFDPALVDRLIGKDNLIGKDKPEEESPLGLRIAGIVTIASGLGIDLLSFFVFPVAPLAFYPIIGVGVVAVCVGVGLLICARVVERDQQSRAMGNTGT
jgi:Domain of unknown function (DUF6249)